MINTILHRYLDAQAERAFERFDRAHLALHLRAARMDALLLGWRLAIEDDGQEWVEPELRNAGENADLIWRGPRGRTLSVNMLNGQAMARREWGVKGEMSTHFDRITPDDITALWRWLMASEG